MSGAESTPNKQSRTLNQCQVSSCPYREDP